IGVTSGVFPTTCSVGRADYASASANYDWIVEAAGGDLGPPIPKPRITAEWNDATGALNDAVTAQKISVYVLDAGDGSDAAVGNGIAQKCTTAIVGGIAQHIDYQASPGYAGYWQVHIGPLWDWTPTGSQGIRLVCNHELSDQFTGVTVRASTVKPFITHEW